MGEPPACAPTKATSRPRSSSTVPGSGPNRSARWPVSTFRCIRPNTSTWSPRTSTESTPTCRSCATPTGTRTSRKRSAVSSSAASSRRPSHGCRPTTIPYPFEFQLLEEDWDHFEILMNNALLRIPALEVTGIKKFYNGPESFTPDNQFILGEAPELDNFFVGAGFNSVGIATAGGAGRALAEWIVNGAPTSDLTGVDIRRFAPFNGNNRWLHDRVAEVLGLHYEIPWPNREMKTARPFRRSPVHHLLQAANANFGSRMGWERANFFAPAGVDPTIEYTWGKPNWLAWSAAEQTNTRTARDRVRPDLVLQVPDGRARRRAGAAVAVHRRRRRGDRQGRLHRNAQRARHIRIRRHRDPHRRRRVLHRQQRRHHRARQGPHPQKPARGRPRVAGRRDVRLRRLRCDGAAVRATCCPPSPPPTCPTTRSRSAPASRSRWDTRPCGRPGSPTSANWVGNSTYPPNSRSVCTRT